MSANATISVFDDPAFYTHLTSITFHCPALILHTALIVQIRKYRLFNELSTNLMYNIGCWWFLMLLGLFMALYTAPQLESSYKSAFIVLYSGISFCALNLSLSISVFFMSLDRIIALTNPIKHKNYYRSLTCLTLTGGLFAFFLDYFAVFLFEPPLPVYTACKGLVCLITSETALVINTSRSCSGILNLIAFLAFRITHFKFWNRAHVNQTTHEQFRRANYCVLVACLTEMLFNVTPQVLSIIMLKLFNKSTASLGPINSALIGMEGLVTTLVYRHLIIRHVNRSTPITVTSNTF